jgi:hypothetical protein
MPKTRIGGWRERKHGANLHRRGLGAQHRWRQVALRGQIERVVIGARRMVRRDIERRKIHPIGLDVGAFGDFAAHGAEDGGDLLHRPADRVDAAVRVRTRRQGWIEPFRCQASVELGFLQFKAARFDASSERVLQPVQSSAALAALLWRGLPQITQECREATAAAQRRNTDGVPRAQVGRRSKCRLGVVLKG